MQAPRVLPEDPCIGRENFRKIMCIEKVINRYLLGTACPSMLFLGWWGWCAPQNGGQSSPMPLLTSVTAPRNPSIDDTRGPFPVGRKHRSRDFWTGQTRPDVVRQQGFPLTGTWTSSTKWAGVVSSSTSPHFQINTTYIISDYQ